MGIDPAYKGSLQEFRMPDAPSLVLKEFHKAPIALTEVQGAAEIGLTTSIPPDDAFLVQLRLIECRRVEYFSENRHLDGIDRGAGVIQFHDLRRNPVAVLQDPFHVLHIHLPLRAINAVAEEMHSPPVDELQLSPSQTLRDSVLRNMFLSLRPVLSRPEEASTLVVNHIALALTTHIAQRYGGVLDRSEFRRGGLAGWQERKARELLDASIDGDIPLSYLALECGLSLRHFSRAFQQSVGVPPHRYLLKRRVENARHLLERSQKSLLEIALACGFADQSHFTRVFRASVGVTPGVWRHVRAGSK